MASAVTLLAIDLGVTFVKTGLYDTRGKCLLSIRKQSPGEHRGKGVFVQRADDYLRVVLDSLAEVVQGRPKQSARIAAISFSGQLAGAVGIDENGNDLTTCSSNMDTRYAPHVTEMIRSSGREMSRLSGTNFPYWGAKLAWWKRDFPELYGRVSKFVFLAGYIISRLGELPVAEAFTDRTYLVMSGLADAARGEWSAELCSSCDLDLSKLPRIVDSTAVVGRLSRRHAALCGLTAGIPLVAGAGDKPAGALGAGLTTPGAAVDESASFGAYSICTDSFVPDTDRGIVEVIPAPIPGLYYPTSFLLGSGITVSWLAKLMAGSGRSERSTLKKWEDRAAELAPGSDGLLAVGLLDGRAYPYDPDVRGMWIGHGWTHGPEHFFRSLLESYAYEYRQFSSAMREIYGQQPCEVTVIGGGAESDLWNQIKSDVLGVPYVRLDRDDLALLGDVVLGGHAVGIYSDIASTAASFVRKTARFLPDASRHEAYEGYYKLYQGLFEKTRSVYADLNRLSGIHGNG